VDITKNMNSSEKEIFKKYQSNFPFRVVDFINELKIKIYSKAMDNVSGAICKENNEFVIYVNEKHPATRLRFTLAHELGHYFYDREFLEKTGTIEDSTKQLAPSFLYRKECLPDDPEMRKRDVKANQFAAQLLMPEEKFIEVWHNENSPEEVAKFFNVSVDAIKIRAASVLGVMF